MLLHSWSTEETFPEIISSRVMFKLGFVGGMYFFWGMLWLTTLTTA